MSAASGPAPRSPFLEDFPADFTARLVAFDIKTRPLASSPDPSTALDPAHAEVSSVAFFGHAGSELFTLGEDHLDSEPTLLSHAASYLAELPTDSILVGWNSSVFDLPFLAARFAACPPTLRSLGPEVSDTGELSKHGDPVFEGSWVGLDHLDLCLLLRHASEEHRAASRLSWALHTAAADLGLAPTSSGSVRSFTFAPARQRVFALSDVRTTYQIAVLAAALGPSHLCDLRLARTV